MLVAFCFVYGFYFASYVPVRLVQFAFPIVILAGLAIWALPDLGYAPTRSIERLYFAFFLAVPLWPNYLAIALPGLPWITVLRLVGFPLVFLLLLSVSISKEFRRDIAGPLNAVPMLWKFVAAFSILEVLSVGLSNSPQFSIQRLVIALSYWTAMFFAAAHVFRKPGRVEVWAGLLVICALVMAGIAAREFQLSKVLWAGHIPSFLAVDDESVQRTLSGSVRSGTTRYRAQSTYSTPLGLGEFLAISTPFILHFIGGQYRLFFKLVALVSIPIVLFAIILTDTRLGLVGFIMSIGLYIFLWGALRWRQNPKSIVGPAVVLSYPAVALAFIAAVFLIPRLRAMTLGGGRQQASTEARVEQINQGIPLVFKHPWGFGIGRGAEALGYKNAAGAGTIDTYWLLIALDYGILGFFLFYSIFIIAIWVGFRTVITGTKARELSMIIPLTIALVVFVVIKSIYSGVENQSIIFMMLGAVSALVFRAKQERAMEQEMRDAALQDTPATARHRGIRLKQI